MLEYAGYSLGAGFCKILTFSVMLANQYAIKYELGEFELIQIQMLSALNEPHFSPQFYGVSCYGEI